jgi:hypothetical protein
MTVDEKDTMIENLLADNNAAMAAQAGLMHLVFPFRINFIR